MAKFSKNQIALQANEQALDKARNDLAKAQTTVMKLTQKIPELERAVLALKVLCGTPRTTFKNSKTGEETEVRPLSPEELVVSGFSHTAPIPEGIGSIPAALNLIAMETDYAQPGQRQPKPTTGNVAQEIKREGGFS